MTSDARVYAYSAVLMGSPILLKLFEHNESLASRVFRLIKQQENIFTVNRHDSDVMAINHAAGSHAVRVSQPVFNLIRCAKAVSELPDSSFNFTIGPLVKRWKISFSGNSVPDAASLRALLPLTNPHDVQLDDASRSVFLQKAGMEIDLGAIAKGYIADRVRDYLRKEGVVQGLINLGGNVQTLGTPEGGWSIGLKKPFSTSGSMIGTLEIAHKSVVTSGVYERFFEHNGQIYHHILDPRTGYPLNNELDSVTIVSENSIDGDIWTTLMYGMGVEKGCAALRARPDIEAIFVTKAKEVVLSSSHHYRFTLLDNDYRLIGSTV